MVFVILANIYTMRIVWQSLGIVDYGIYSVVAGFVLMFEFLRSAMVAASQRYFSFGLGTNNQLLLNEYFRISIITYSKLGIIILVVGEIFGSWFLNTEMNIPIDRIYAANIVYQMSLLSFILAIIIVPYNGVIVSHEKMGIYGYIGIFESILKLLIAFILIFINYDRLIVYSIMLFITGVIINVITVGYCRYNFKECILVHKGYNAKLSRQIFSFAGWSILGNLGFSLRDQGLNIIVNMFFNVTLNAAKGVGFQVAAVVRGFTSNFQMALNPQIVKTYANNEIDNMISLILRGCKFSYYLLLIIAVPLYMKAELVLTLWLSNINSFMVGFLQLSLILVLIESFVGPITAALQATGRIKLFQIIISSIMMSTLVISIIWLQIDRTPYIVMWSSIITSVIGIVARIILLKREVEIRTTKFIMSVFLPSFIVTVISFIVANNTSPFFKDNLSGLILFSIFTTISIGFAIYCFGLDKLERLYVKRAIISKILKSE